MSKKIIIKRRIRVRVVYNNSKYFDAEVIVLTNNEFINSKMTDEILFALERANIYSDNLRYEIQYPVKREVLVEEVKKY